MLEEAVNYLEHIYSTLRHEKEKEASTQPGQRASASQRRMARQRTAMRPARRQNTEGKYLLY